MKLKSILIRAFSGIIYVGIIVGCILWDQWTLAALATLLAGLSTVELSRLLHGVTPRRFPLVVIDVAAAVSLALGVYIYPLVVWVFCMILRFVEELYAKEQDPVRSLAYSCLAQIYIAVPCFMLLATDVALASPKILLAIFFFLWINDTGAFLVGSMMGKHKFFERISPKKTWEGFIGGCLFNVGAAFIFCYACGDFFGHLLTNIYQWLGLAVIVTLFGTLGDLVESLMKRTVGVKDSGNLIPGHGGILDRIDSMLLALPASFLYLLILQLARPLANL